METRWIERGGDPRRLALYRQLGRVETLADESGRALIFANGAVGDFTGDARLLSRAEDRLRAWGVTEAVGPLDGNTFFPYRVNLGPLDVRPFSGEPTGCPEPWRRLGWREDARYTSSICPNAPQIENARPLPAGWRARPVDFDRFAPELEALYRVTLGAFSEAWRYMPLPFPAFSALYSPYRDRVDPRWVRVAEDPEGTVQGYLFAWPEEGRFVIKTLAVHPDARGKRVSSHLMGLVHAFAAEQGIPAGIHALMWEGSLSQVVTAHGSRVFRRYALYRKRL